MEAITLRELKKNINKCLREHPEYADMKVHQREGRIINGRICVPYVPAGSYHYLVLE